MSIILYLESSYCKITFYFIYTYISRSVSLHLDMHIIKIWLLTIPAFRIWYLHFNP